MKDQPPYDYNLSYESGPKWSQDLGASVPTFVKVLVVFTPPFALFVLTVLMWIGQL